MTKEQRMKLDRLIVEYGDYQYARSHPDIKEKALHRITDYLDLIQWNTALYNLRRAGKPFGISVSMDVDNDEDMEKNREALSRRYVEVARWKAEYNKACKQRDDAIGEIMRIRKVVFLDTSNEDADASWTKDVEEEVNL